ncbi:MAG: hypothetical protein WBF06_03130 [Candidatus Acidiferrales bacterium]
MRGGERRLTGRSAKVHLLALIVALFSISARAQAPAATQAPPPAADSSGSTSAPPGGSTAAPAPDDAKSKKEKTPKDDAPVVIASWLNIDVVGGTDKVPVQEASVYVKFTVVRKRLRDQKLEFDLKTNQEGVARAPDIPQGKVLIQIVATGWKTFGEYYDVDSDQQTIDIQLVRPPRWY